MEQPLVFDINCRRCERLAEFLAEVRHKYPVYHAKPVAPFGDPAARLLIVGLAPGMHGANATGRPFTGDHAGIILYQLLYEYGFSNQPSATSREDGLTLTNCRITNAVKCLPPANKPLGAEVKACNGFLHQELQTMPPHSVILTLGRIAHEALVRAAGLSVRALNFSHGATHRLPNDRWLIDSYHCSRYNTQTKRLTEAMFRQVFEKIATLLDGGH